MAIQPPGCTGYRSGKNSPIPKTTSYRHNGAPSCGVIESGGELVGAAASISNKDFEPLVNIQAIAATLYGRLEIERALNWTLEELGELAQAVRRDDEQLHLEEELGQLTAWMFCLANILDLDLAAAAHRAFAAEAERQVSKYGHLQPYKPGS